jgi:hypothetical protein
MFFIFFHTLKIVKVFKSSKRMFHSFYDISEVLLGSHHYAFKKYFAVYISLSAGITIFGSQSFKITYKALIAIA